MSVPRARERDYIQGVNPLTWSPVNWPPHLSYLVSCYHHCAGVSNRECSSRDRAQFNRNLIGLFTEEYQRDPRLLQRTVEMKGLLSLPTMLLALIYLIIDLFPILEPDSSVAQNTAIGPCIMWCVHQRGLALSPVPVHTSFMRRPIRQTSKAFCLIS